MRKLDHLSPSECLILNVWDDSVGYGWDRGIEATIRRCGITAERLGEVIEKANV